MVASVVMVVVSASLPTSIPKNGRICEARTTNTEMIVWLMVRMLADRIFDLYSGR